MSTSTKNIGQVSGLYIGKTAPTNTKLIWYSTISNCHNVYNNSSEQWTPLNPEIIGTISYLELNNELRDNGLSIGKKYIISENFTKEGYTIHKGTLVVVITDSKIQYTDANGNIVIDDLGSNVKYIVNSSNITIDDINGVLENGKLKFSFEDNKKPTAEDYILGEKKAGIGFKFSKFSIKRLLSTNEDNSIKWEGGFFFSFKKKIEEILNKKGGIVGKDKYDTDIEAIKNNINDSLKKNDESIKGIKDSITVAVSPTAIYNKELPKSIDTSAEPGDIKKGDALFTIVSKIQQWINKFKYATGIKISANFSAAEKLQDINNNDTVESALAKVQYILKNLYIVTALPEDFKIEGNSFNSALNNWLPKGGDAVADAISKITDRLNEFLFSKLLSASTQQGGGRYLKQYPEPDKRFFDEDFDYDEYIKNEIRASEFKDILKMTSPSLLQVFNQISFNQRYISEEFIDWDNKKIFNLSPSEILTITIFDSEQVSNDSLLSGIKIGAVIYTDSDDSKGNFLKTTGGTNFLEINEGRKSFKNEIEILSMIPVTEMPAVDNYNNMYNHHSIQLPIINSKKSFKYGINFFVYFIFKKSVLNKPLKYAYLKGITSGDSTLSDVLTSGSLSISSVNKNNNYVVYLHQKISVDQVKGKEGLCNYKINFELN